MFDGDAKTSWLVQAVERGDPQWVVLDLGTDASLSQLKLYKDSAGGVQKGALESGVGPAGPWHKVVDVSTSDGKTWQQVVKQFPPATSRYWRLSISKLWQDSGGSALLGELGFYGYKLPKPQYMLRATSVPASSVSGVLGAASATWSSTPRTPVYGGLLLCAVGIVLRYTVFARTRRVGDDGQEYSQVVELEGDSNMQHAGERSRAEPDGDATESDDGGEGTAGAGEEQPLDGGRRKGTKENPFAADYRT